MLRRRGRRNRATGKVIANAINIAHDKNERFIKEKFIVFEASFKALFYAGQRDYGIALLGLGK